MNSADKMAQAVFYRSQLLVMETRLEAMRAANIEAEASHFPVAYNEEEFMELGKSILELSVKIKGLCDEQVTG